MGLPSRFSLYARHSDGAHRGDDCRKTSSEQFLRRGAVLACLILLAPWSAFAETITIATYNVDMARKGPGLLLRDILRGNDPQGIGGG